MSDAVDWAIERHDERERKSHGITWVGNSGGGCSESEGPRTTVQSCRAGKAAAARQTRFTHVCNGGAAPRSKGRTQLCSLAVRAEPHRQGRPGALTYAMAGAALRRRAAHYGAVLPCGRNRSGKADQARSHMQWRRPHQDRRAAHNCAVLPCGQSRTGKADQVRSHMQWRGPLRDRRIAHDCAVLPCGRNRTGKADQVRS